MDHMLKLAHMRQSPLVRNAGWMLAGQAAVMVTQLAYFMVLARLLGSTEYGSFVGASAMSRSSVISARSVPAWCCCAM